MEKCKHLENAAELNEIHEIIMEARFSLVFALVYDVNSEEEINTALLNFVGQKGFNRKYKIGVTVESREKGVRFDSVQRDQPIKDIQMLFLDIKDTEDMSVYDTLVNAVNGFSADSTKKVVIAIILNKRNTIGAASIDNLNIFQNSGIELIVAYRHNTLIKEFQEYLQREGVNMLKIEHFTSFDYVLEEILGIISRFDMD